MGFSGRILVARTGGPYAGEGAAVLWEDDRGDGWRWIQLDGDVPGVLGELVATTGAPAISAYILDSDVADVEALTPAGQGWHTYLHPRMAADYQAPPLPQSPAEVFAAALDWAVQAGLSPDPGAARDALQAHNVEVEETLDELVTALGVPASR